MLESIEVPLHKAVAWQSDGLIAITADKQGLASILCKTLQAAGLQAQVVKQLEQPAAMVILLDGFALPDDAEKSLALHQQLLHHLQRLPTVLASGGRLIAVQNSGGYFGLQQITTPAQALTAGVAGLVKTAVQEFPQVQCKIIDLDSQQDVNAISMQISDELRYDQQHCVEVGYAKNGQRHCLQVVPEKANPQTLNLVKDDVVLVSGGGRGITAGCLLRLAKEQRLRFILLGRSELVDIPSCCAQANDDNAIMQALLQQAKADKQLLTPPQLRQQVSKISASKAIQRTVQQLQHLGSEVVYVPVDVLNPTALAQALAPIRQRWQRIDAIIHGAGVLADKRIVDKTDEQFSRVFTTKVTGLMNLLQVTAEDDLKQILLFSSVAGRFGNIGQADYAAANEVLNKIAQYEKQRRGNSCLVKSINWGPWDSGMVDAGLKKQFAERGVQIIDKLQGEACFLVEMQTTEQVEVVYGQALQTEFQQLIAITETRYAYLRDHRIKKMLVVPACLVLHWFMQAVRQFRPLSQVVGCENFQLVKGIQFNDFSPVPILSVHCTYADEGKASCELRDQENRVRYKAMLQIADNPLAAPTISINTYQQAWKVKPIYAGKKTAVLFHGDAFQVIKQLQTMDDSGGCAVLSTANKPIARDVLLFDGILQLLIVWGQQQLGKKTLPVKFSQVNIYQSTLPEQVHCQFTSKLNGQLGTVSDAYLLDEQGQCYAEFLGIEMYVQGDE